MLRDMLLRDLLNARIPIIINVTPTRLTRQSAIPFERFKQIFHTASVKHERKRYGIPGFIEIAKLLPKNGHQCQLCDNLYKQVTDIFV
jgi:hypothetical protein